MRKIRERQFVTSGQAGPRWQVRVRELADGEPLPEGAELVDEATPTHEWKNEEMSQK